MTRRLVLAISSHRSQLRWGRGFLHTDCSAKRIYGRPSGLGRSRGRGTQKPPTEHGSSEINPEGRLGAENDASFPPLSASSFVRFSAETATLTKETATLFPVAVAPDRCQPPPDGFCDSDRQTADEGKAANCPAALMGVTDRREYSGRLLPPISRTPNHLRRCPQSPPISVSPPASEAAVSERNMKLSRDIWTMTLSDGDGRCSRATNHGGVHSFEDLSIHTHTEHNGGRAGQRNPI